MKLEIVSHIRLLGFRHKAAAEVFDVERLTNTFYERYLSSLNKSPRSCDIFERLRLQKTFDREFRRIFGKIIQKDEHLGNQIIYKVSPRVDEMAKEIHYKVCPHNRFPYSIGWYHEALDQ